MEERKVFLLTVIPRESVPEFISVDIITTFTMILLHSRSFKM